MKNVFMGFAVFAGMIVAIVLLTVYCGWIGQMLWNWYLVRLGAPYISLPMAVGLSACKGFLTYRYSKAEGDEAWTKLADAIIVVTLLGITGWAAHFFL